MGIAVNINKLKKELPSNVKIVAVSKKMSIESIMEAYQAGHNIFGENRAQELITKYPLLPKDIEWHFIGHLQTNKVKTVVPAAYMIQSVDSIRLLHEINDESGKHNKIMNCLLQLSIASEDTKYGLTAAEIFEIAGIYAKGAFKNVILRGLMGMATFTDNQIIIKEEFSKLVKLFNEIRSSILPGKNTFTEMSMGMSNDYKLAVDSGATIVRIGSLIFGERPIIDKK